MVEPLHISRVIVPSATLRLDVQHRSIRSVGHPSRRGPGLPSFPHSLCSWYSTRHYRAPSLRGILGRSVAAESGFSYAPSMLAYGAQQPVWTRGALDAFIAEPQAIILGKEMGFFGIRTILRWPA